jgi:DNA-binding transcriptional LysR family regulator
MRHILAIIENDGSISRAAEKMSITQPALSQILKKVETEHGVQLFDRGKSPMVLTKAGRVYLDAARRIKEIGDSMQREFDDEQNLRTGELRIGTTPFHAAYVIPRPLASFHRKYPHVSIVLRQTTNGELLRMMEEAETDITLCDFHGPDVQLRGFVVRELYRDELTLFVHPDHPIASLDVIDDLTLLRDELVITPVRGDPARDAIDKYFEDKNFIPGRIVEAGNAEFSLRILREGVGASILRSAIIGAEGADPPPARVRLGQNPPEISASVVYSKARYLSSSARAFLGELGETFRSDLV